jgi:hypothetical protein
MLEPFRTVYLDLNITLNSASAVLVVRNNQSPHEQVPFSAPFAFQVNDLAAEQTRLKQEAKQKQDEVKKEAKEQQEAAKKTMDDENHKLEEEAHRVKDEARQAEKEKT